MREFNLGDIEAIFENVIKSINEDYYPYADEKLDICGIIIYLVEGVKEYMSDE